MELVKSSKDEKIEKHLLMLNDPTKKEIIDFGNELFPNSAKKQLESLVGEKIEKDRIQTTIKSLSKKYKYVFSEKEIYEECLEYNLSFAETSSYREDFDYTYIEKIKKFVEDNNLLVSRQELRYNFMILTKTFGNKNPLIFYKHKEAGTTYYILIEGDLSYRNLFNWFLGYLHSTKKSMMFGIAMLTILSTLILGHTLMFLFNSTDVCIQLLILFAAVVIGLISTACVTECSYNTFSENRLSALPKKSFKIKTKDFIIVGFWLLSLLSVFYFFNTLNYTLIPKEVLVTKESNVNHVELRQKYNMVPQAGKSYKLIQTDLVLRKGFIFYTKDSLIQSSKPVINACR